MANNQANPLSCEAFLLNESEKFKQIGTDKATDIVVQTNKLPLKQQLVNHDKVFIVNASLLNSKKSSRTGVFHQILTTCAILILAAACGKPIGYSSVILPQLVNTNDTLAVDYNMASWIASIHSLATPLGSLASGPFMDKFGRRTTLIISILPLMIGWVTIALANSHFFILLGRVIAGMSVGIIGAPAQVLIAEIAEPHLRGLLIGVPFVAYSCGILIVYWLGTMFNWRSVAWLSLVLPAFSMVAISLTVESPTWLARNGYYDRAGRALSWLRGGDLNAKSELNRLIAHNENDKANGNQNRSTFELIKQAQVLKPLVLVNLFNLLQIFSGTYLIVFYAVDIITEICNSSTSLGESYEINTQEAATITALVRLIVTIIYCFLLLYCKRRSMYITAGVCSGISSLVLSTFLYSKSGATKSFADLLFIAVCILLYIAANSAFIAIPGIMIGELLPAQARGKLAGSIFTVFHMMLFCVTKVFPYIKQYTRSQGLFFIFGCSSLFISIAFYFLLPETKNRSLNEIEDYYKQKNWLWQNRHKNNSKSDDKS